MSAGIAAIGLFAPVVASNAIFSARRVKRGVDAIDENPLYALTNFDIAAAQVLKGSRAVKGLAALTNPVVEQGMSAADTIAKMQKVSKPTTKIGKIINFTADHVNPLICVASGIKVLGSEDKTDTAAREVLALSSMFASEKLAKNILGLPKTTKDAAGKLIHEHRDGIFEKAYKNILKDSQKTAIKDFVKTKQFVKYVPGAAKGFLFVGASIAGYTLGEKLGNKILGEKKEQA